MKMIRVHCSSGDPERTYFDDKPPSDPNTRTYEVPEDLYQAWCHAWEVLNHLESMLNAATWRPEPK